MKYKYLLLPQNYLAEEILLGIIFIYPNIFYNIINIIKIEYFFLENHRIIYSCLIHIYKKNKLNLNNILYHLANINILYKIGGINNISNLMKQSQIFITSFFNINIYTEEITNLIQSSYIKRILIQYSYNIIKISYIPKTTHYKLYNKASLYLNITEKKIPLNFTKKFKYLITDFLINKKKYNRINKIQSNIIKSGFKELDILINGFSKGELIVLAGRPSTGKTSLIINIAYNILIQYKNISICIFSLEVSNKQLMEKFICLDSKISFKYIIKQYLNKFQWNKIIKTCHKLINFNIYIDDKSNTSIDYIEYTSKLLQRENSKINIIIIDYLQLIQIDSFYKTNRNQELSYITRKLKLLAQYLRLPIIILSQLNRNIENRNNKTPILSDLKESGCITDKYQINIKNNKLNKINLINVLNQNLIYIKTNKIIHININKQKQKTINIYPNIIISNGYTFESNIKNINNLYTTYNHKYIFINLWQKIFLTVDNSLIATHFNLRNYILDQTNITYSYQIKHILFIDISKCYDLNTQNYFNFICMDIILHNSIEQDADIVMMIYKKNDEKNLKEDNTILDCIINKNRNGPTGSFKLLFLQQNILFQEINSDHYLT